MGTLEGAVAFSERIANGRYYYDTGPGRCDPIHSGYADCSGLVVASLRDQDVSIDCTGSFMLARICHAAGTGISLEEARRTRGALLFIGINQGQGGRPGIDPGHVARSRGDGTTVEARNHRAGILIGPFDYRGWTYAARDPWLHNNVPPPPPPPEPVPVPEEEMDLFYDEVHPGKDSEHPRSVSVNGQGDLLLGNGIKITDSTGHGITPISAAHQQVIPANLPGMSYRGSRELRDGAGRTHGITQQFVKDSDGTWHLRTRLFSG